jgi:hypothetical protein
MKHGFKGHASLRGVKLRWSEVVLLAKRSGAMSLAERKSMFTVKRFSI